jgi:hypothetical protein
MKTLACCNPPSKPQNYLQIIAIRIFIILRHISKKKHFPFWLIFSQIAIAALKKSIIAWQAEAKTVDP